ncbi:MAG: tRNA adenosine(34) deaminase TadA [Bacillota bacterium]
MTSQVPDHEYFMKLALAQAQLAYDAGEVPVGAVVVCNDQVVAAAHNLRESTNDPTAHAEMLAIRAASQNLGRWRLTGCTLYCTIEPCPMCAGALVLSRIDRLVYGAADPRAGACGSLLDLPRNPALNHRVEVIAGVLAEECSTLMKGFFANLRTEGCRSG